MKLKYDNSLRRWVFGFRLFKSVADAEAFYKENPVHAKREGWKQ